MSTVWDPTDKLTFFSLWSSLLSLSCSQNFHQLLFYEREAGSKVPNLSALGDTPPQAQHQQTASEAHPRFRDQNTSGVLQGKGNCL